MDPKRNIEAQELEKEQEEAQEDDDLTPEALAVSGLGQNLGLGQMTDLLYE